MKENSRAHIIASWVSMVVVMTVLVGIGYLYQNYR